MTSSLAARIDGDDCSPVVLLHGLVASGIYWGAAYDTVARQHRLVVPSEAPAWLADLTQPVRMVGGDRDRVVDHRFLGELASDHDNVSAETWSGGHDLPLARPLTAFKPSSE